MDEMTPEPAGLTDQLTAVFGLPRTVAVNCWDWPGLSVTGAWSMVTSVVAEFWMISIPLMIAFMFTISGGVGSSRCGDIEIG